MLNETFSVIFKHRELTGSYSNSILPREYRHRRRHRKDLNKVIDESQENIGEAKVGTNGINEEEAIITQKHDNPVVQQSNSFRRRRNESGEENPFTKRKMERDKDVDDSIEETGLKDTLPIVGHSYISTEMAPIQATIQLNNPLTEEHTAVSRSIHDDQSGEPCISHGLSNLSNVPDVKEESKEIEEEDDPLGFIGNVQL